MRRIHLCLVSGCNTDNAPHTELQQETLRSEPLKEKQESVFVTAQTTGVTMLTNVNELRFFEGTGRVTFGDRSGRQQSLDSRWRNRRALDIQRQRAYLERGRRSSAYPSYSVAKPEPFSGKCPLCFFICDHAHHSGRKCLSAGYTYIYARSTDGGKTFQLPTSSVTFTQVVKVVCDPNRFLPSHT